MTSRGSTPWRSNPIFTVRPRSDSAVFPTSPFTLGDSTSVLPVIVPKLRGKAIHWLDGHYSAGFTGVGASHCPAVVEPESISSLSKDPFESSSTTGGAWARIRLTRRYAMCANLSQRCRTVGHRWQPRRT